MKLTEKTIKTYAIDGFTVELEESVGNLDFYVSKDRSKLWVVNGATVFAKITTSNLQGETGFISSVIDCIDHTEGEGENER